ncbi:UDP-N-acetyl-D-galactosamine dehydrogenase [Amphibacillus marinus]|uniref:UDP-N-acetyl-D-galactosamine dehydrogenase n=1 Tax=Amphibacillus marinus TaxID=872970 RepID=A0A1H8MY17_9BACI|nr:nucleotide sugar dehydrogenase [Amphibacillus marinus]SEO22204.1 UDP-N-acetyl-D-galactosamine dehydrogenase [Amphibacillus marinus]
MNNEKIAILGLGYVGLPLAIAFADHYPVIGFDIDNQKVEQLRLTHQSVRLRLSTQVSSLVNATVYIVTVPTPIYIDNRPDLRPLISATELIAAVLKQGDLVIYESTVYPGTTEEICIPLLEQQSGLRVGQDFKVGYSPERINPADDTHTLTTIPKIVSGTDAIALQRVEQLYQSILLADVHPVSSIKVAEAAKVIENAQRDINIAFMNELSVAFHHMNIDTTEVLAAAATKWNFIPFSPGLVGGHCIGVDPYYFIYKAGQLGYPSPLLSAGRKINEGMGQFIVQQVIKRLITENNQLPIKRIGVLGITFKENCPDIRNSRVVDIIRGLEEYQIEVIVHDPIADLAEVEEQYDIKLSTQHALVNLDACIVAVCHKTFTEMFSPSDFKQALCTGRHTIFDLKAAFNKRQLVENGLFVWRL